MSSDSAESLPVQRNKPRRLKSCLSGCGLLVILCLAAYLISLAIKIDNYYFNRAKWQSSGVSSYTITLEYQFGPGSRQSIVIVRNSQPTSVTGQAPFNSIASVEDLFN